MGMSKLPLFLCILLLVIGCNRSCPPPPTFLAEAVSFEQGGNALAGTLLVPNGPGPFPALVMIQGSGPADRTCHGYFPPIQEYFARQGIAALCYDKPGTGSSTGNWKVQSFYDRAEEALVAVRLLQSRKDVQRDRVGLWGQSQGGWIVPLAASLSKEVAFVIPVAGPGVKPMEQGLFVMEKAMVPAMRRKNFPNQEIEQFIDDWTLLMQAAEMDKPYQEVEARWVRAGSVLERLLGPITGKLNPDDWEFVRKCGRYDPASVLERVTCPVLAIFGECDVAVPTPESVVIFQAALKKAGNPDVTIKVFPQADHGISLEDGKPAPGFYETMGEWVLTRTGHSPSH
jgi:uncharacterized protein